MPLIRQRKILSPPPVDGGHGELIGLRERQLVRREKLHARFALLARGEHGLRGGVDFHFLLCVQQPVEAPRHTAGRCEIVDDHVSLHRVAFEPHDVAIETFERRLAIRGRGVTDEIHPAVV